jgi:hypothetical protein
MPYEDRAILRTLHVTRTLVYLLQQHHGPLPADVLRQLRPATPLPRCGTSW